MGVFGDAAIVAVDTPVDDGGAMSEGGVEEEDEDGGELKEADSGHAGEGEAAGEPDENEVEEGDPDQRGGDERRHEGADGGLHVFDIAGEVDEGVGEGHAEEPEDLDADDGVEGADEAKEGDGEPEGGLEARAAAGEREGGLAEQADDEGIEDVLVNGDSDAGEIPLDLGPGERGGGMEVDDLAGGEDEGHPEGEVECGGEWARGVGH